MSGRKTLSLQNTTGLARATLGTCRAPRSPLDLRLHPPPILCPYEPPPEKGATFELDSEAWSVGREMKGEGKMGLRSKKMKWVGMLGLFLSAVSLFVHFFLARFSYGGVSEYLETSSITIFSWRPYFENSPVVVSRDSPLYRRLWGPVRPLEFLHPYANPRGQYPEPRSQINGYIFVRIQGGFHEIRNSIADVVVVARLLNATLVIPEIQSTTSSKGISSEFKSFSYLYNDEQFITALTRDVKVIKTLPKHLKTERRNKKIPLFRLPYQASPYFYLHHVLPVMAKHLVVELVVADGGCLKAILPLQFEELQRLRCRVAFHALRFRQEVQELAINILDRLKSPGKPFIAYDPGMTREALAFHGCAELFQDVHSELILHKRAWMLKRGIVKGNLSVDSSQMRLNGLCPLMPEEVGILLRAFGYSSDTIIYISGGEVFGGQRILIPFHAMFENIVDRTSLSAAWELNRIYGRETNMVPDYPKKRPFVDVESKREEWETMGPRPRPLPPPPARPKYPYNIEGWWGWVAESDNEPDSTVIELRTNAHKLLWEAIDYIVSVEADVFVSGFEDDGKGHPSFSSLVMGHRLYQSASSRTYRSDRKLLVKLLDDIRDNFYEANRTWLTSVRRHLQSSLLDGQKIASKRSKSRTFLTYPVPECSCLKRGSTGEPVSRAGSQLSNLLHASAGTLHQCPAWMETKSIPPSKENEDDDDEGDSASTSLFFARRGGGGGNGNGNGSSHEGGGDASKEEEDQEELEGGEN